MLEKRTNLFSHIAGFLVLFGAIALWADIGIRGVLRHYFYAGSWYDSLLFASAAFMSACFIFSIYYKSGLLSFLGLISGVAIFPGLKQVPPHLGRKIMPVIDALQSPLWQLQGILLSAGVALFGISLLVALAHFIRYAMGRTGLLRNRGEEGLLARWDFISFRMMNLGFFLVSLGMIVLSKWQLEAWSTAWTFDLPDAALFAGWISYGIYLHMKAQYECNCSRMLPLAALSFFLVSAHFTCGFLSFLY